MTRNLTLVALAALTACVGAQTVYQPRELGALNGQSEAFAINAAGNAVGWSFTSAGTRQAVLFSNGRVTPLMTPAGKNSVALGIDRAGRMVGQVDRQAAIWTSAQVYQMLGTLGGQESRAYAINDNGVIACGSQNGAARWRAGRFDYPNGAMTELPGLGGAQGQALAANNGNLAGYFDLANGRTHAALWANGQVLDFGTLGGPASTFIGSNDQGMAVGSSLLADRHFTPQNRGFVRRAMTSGTNRTLRNLGEPYAPRPYQNLTGGYRTFTFTYQDGAIRRTVQVAGVDVEATDANSTTVVGNATLYLYPSGQLKRAVAWINGRFTDLNTLLPANSGWQLNFAWGINASGQIVGAGRSAQGAFRAYRLDPAAANGTGLEYTRFGLSLAGTVGAPIAETRTTASIPTVTLFVRKSDGRLATSLTGPYSTDALAMINQTLPRVVGGSIRLVVDERSTQRTPGATQSWSNVCDQFQTQYAAFRTGQSGGLTVLWNGTNMRNILNPMTQDSQVSARFRFTRTNTAFLAIRLVVRKGQGW
jgi:probable HAF family extracellular repeat protein